MKKQIAWLPVLLWMGVIFVMSAMPGETSSEQSGTIVKLLSAVYGFLTGGAALPQRAVDLARPAGAQGGTYGRICRARHAERTRFPAKRRKAAASFRPFAERSLRGER